jgi:DNA replication factor GINS
MYNELYVAWRREVDDSSLGGLPSDFYVKIVDYLKKITEENKLQEKKSLKILLLEHESQHVQRMLEELLRLRYEKLLKVITETKKVPINLLASEEAKMCESFFAFTEAYQKFSSSLLLGQEIRREPVVEPEKPILKTEVPHKRVPLRFSKNVPSIIGVDMKPYGPFMAEDVASVPVENAKILVKQGLAVQVDLAVS